MITSSSIPYITQMLSEPQNISQADNDSIAALTETYPYFVAARYMDAANKHKKEPFTPPMMAMMQLYMGNWLMYCQFLQSTVNGAEVEPKAVAKESTPAAPEPVVTTTADVPVVEEFVATQPTAVAEEEQQPVQEEEITATADAEPVDIVMADEEEAVAAVEEETGETTGETAEESVEEPPYTMRPPIEDEDTDDETLILPIYTEDYFLHQGMHVSNKIPENVEDISKKPESPQSLMVVMSFSEWLMHFKTKKEHAQEEESGQKALKTMWQKEKLAAALEEENEEIPENVFEMAVNSIAKEDDLVSESLAEIHTKQGKYDKAIEMYRKLSLRNPQKKAYFARKIEAIYKEKQS